MPFNEIMWPGFSNWLQKRLGIEGGDPAPVLAPEITPTMLVQGERWENYAPMLEPRFATHITQAGVAGQYTYCALDNPSNSNVFVIVEHICLSKHTGVQTHWIGPPPIGGRAALLATLTAGSTYPLDTRIPIRAAGASGNAIIYRGTDVSNALVSLMLRIKPGVDATSDMEHIPNLGYVLTPGTCLGIVEPDATNLGMSGYIIWRERPAMRGEFTGA